MNIFLNNDKILLTLLLIFSISSCTIIMNRKNINDTIPLSTALEYYKLNNINDWKLEKKFIQDSVLNFSHDLKYSGGYYYYTKTIKDSLFWLAFEYYKSEIDTIFIPIELYKRYQDSFNQYILLFGENSDTLFFYKAELFRDLHKIFISGKYYYQYKFNYLSNRQRAYFISHQDSLTIIKGHNLNELPNY